MQKVASGVVLAAGGSSRMGHPKALLELDGRAWVCHHLDAMRPWCHRLVVVVGAHAERVLAVLPADATVVANQAWRQTEIMDSLRLGIADLEDDALVLVSPVDTPPAPAQVLAALVAVGGPAVPNAGGMDGHPVVVRAADARLAATLSDALAGAARVETGWTDGLLNVNTPEQWRRWRNSEA